MKSIPRTFFILLSFGGIISGQTSSMPAASGPSSISPHNQVTKVTSNAPGRSLFAASTAVGRTSGGSSSTAANPGDDLPWRRFFPGARVLSSEPNQVAESSARSYLLETPGKHGRIRIIDESLTGEPGGVSAMVANQVLIKMKPNASESALRKAIRDRGASVRRGRLANGFYVVELEQAATAREFSDAIEGLRQLSDYVDTVEPDYLRLPAEVPNDPQLGAQWSLSKIQAYGAWDQVTISGDPVVVAVIDSGVDVDHPDLASQIWTNPTEIEGNGLDDDGNGKIDDVHGWNFAAESAVLGDSYNHGTPVAGIIAARRNNGIGIAGLAKNTRLMVLKNGESSSAVSDNVEAIYYAVQKGAKVINMSYGGKNFSQAESDALTYARNAGVVLVASAGNTGSSLYTVYPANLDVVISVAATTMSDQLASFSSYGLLTDISAPGEGLQTLSGNGTAGYTSFSGTSAAAPVISGVVALMLQQHPGFTPEEVRAILQATAQDIEQPGWDNRTSYGRVNALAAVSEVSGLELTISSPIMASIATGTISIRGTVRGTGLAQWTVEYGSGEGAASFTAISTQTSAITNGLLATWNTTGRADGRYTLRLRATNQAGRVFTRRVVVDVGNSFATIVPGWPSSQIPLSQKCVADVDGDGVPELIGTGGACAIGIVRGNGTYLPGWPKQFYPEQIVISMAAVGDLNGDGAPEVVFMTQHTNSTYVTLHVYRRDGSVVPGWPQTFSRGLSFTSDSSTLGFPVLADVDRDGVFEIVVLSSTAEFTGRAVVNVFKGDGNQLKGFPVTLWENSVGSKSAVTVADFDGDGSLDIASTTADSKVFVLKRDGNLMNGWPVALGTPAAEGGAVAFADFNHDGVMDLFAGVGSGHIAIYDKNGQAAPGWPKKMTENARLPAIADLDGNGDLEIAIASVNVYVGGQRLLYVWHHDGLLAPGYPRSESNMSDPIVADIDGDGSLNIIACSFHYTFAFNLSGQSVQAFGLPRAGGKASNIVAGDFLGDGTIDLLLVEDSNPFAYALLNYRAAAAADRMPWPQQALSAQKNARLVRARLSEFNGQQFVVRGSGTPINLGASDWIIGSTVTVGGVICPVEETVNGLQIMLPGSLPAGVHDLVIDNANAGTFTFPAQLCVVTSATGDDDDDGLPNDWEWQHGLNVFDDTGANGAFGDFDQDDRTNLLEYVLGSDPSGSNDSDAYAVSSDASGIYFTYRVRTALSGINCRAEWSDSLVQNLWSAQGLTIVSQTTFGQPPGMTEIRIKLDYQPSSAFFRIVAERTP